MFFWPNSIIFFIRLARFVSSVASTYQNCLMFWNWFGYLDPYECACLDPCECECLDLYECAWEMCTIPILKVAVAESFCASRGWGGGWGGGGGGRTSLPCTYYDTIHTTCDFQKLDSDKSDTSSWQSQTGNLFKFNINILHINDNCILK